jgi:hypothetical protein
MVMKKRMMSGWVTVTGPPFLYLLLETGDDGLPLLPRTLPKRVVMNLGAGLRPSHALMAQPRLWTVYLGKAFAAAHDVGGVDGLVGGNHNHLLRCRSGRSHVGHLTGALTTLTRTASQGFSSMSGTCL